jgi:hypothetical protein
MAEIRSQQQRLKPMANTYSLTKSAQTLRRMTKAQLTMA